MPRAPATTNPVAVWMGTPPRTAPASRRIVSLAPNITEILFAVGAGPRVVGVTRYCDEPVEARRRTNVGGFLDPNLEAIVAQKPDIVMVVPNSGNRDVVEKLSAWGISVLALRIESIATLRDAMTAVGDAVGEPAHTAKAVAAIDAAIARTQSLGKSRAKLRALIVVGREPTVVAGRGTFLDELLTIVGGENAVATPLFPTLTAEAVDAARPDRLIDVADRTEGSQPPEAYWARIKLPPGARIVHEPSTAMRRISPRVGITLVALHRALWGETK
ncbi:MAG: ABC transporter substrate-binding protein [Deltaproteobacteria bacterium]|nr:ABC transporter substrate-binding protein [Deltaproteobacteria bacterium]